MMTIGQPKTGAMENRGPGGWRYQLVYVDYPDCRIFSLCEVGLTESGLLRWWTEGPAIPQGETFQELSKDLAWMMAAAYKWVPVPFSTLALNMTFQQTGADVENMTGAMNRAIELDRSAGTRPPETAAHQWQAIETAPKDGTWILGINNRGNQAVIIWSDSALTPFDTMRDGWIHPFSDGRLSSFWNGGCGSVPTHWMPLPSPPETKT